MGLKNLGKMDRPSVIFILVAVAAMQMIVGVVFDIALRSASRHGDVSVDVHYLAMAGVMLVVVPVLLIVTAVVIHYRGVE